MKQLFLLLLALFGLMALLNLLASVTARCRRRMEDYAAIRPASAAAGAGAETEPPDPVAPVQALTPPPSPEADARRRRSVREAVLGLLFVPVLAVFTPLNAGLVADAFALLLDRVGTPIGTLDAAGLPIELTDLHLYGLAFSLALILLGAAFVSSSEAGSRWRWFVLCGGIGPLVLLVMWVSAQRGYLLAIDGGAHPLVSPPALAVYNALTGAVMAVTDVVAGYYVVHGLVIPLAAALVAGVVWGVRGLGRLMALLQSEIRRRSEPGRPWWFVRALAYVDEAWFDPLRSLDRAAGRLASGIRLRKEADRA